MLAWYFILLASFFVFWDLSFLQEFKDRIDPAWGGIDGHDVLGRLFSARLGWDLNWCLTKSSILKPGCQSHQTFSFDILRCRDLLDLEPSESFQVAPNYLEIGRHVLAIGLVISIDLVDD